MNKPKAPKLVTVAIFTTITIVFWVFMGLYYLITSKPDVNVDPELLKPIDPSLEQEALNHLENRIFFEPGQTSSPIIVREKVEEEVESTPEEESIEPEEMLIETGSPAASLSE